VVLGLALATTSAHADTKPAPLRTSVAKLVHKARPVVGTGTLTKAKAKVVTRSPAVRTKIRIKTKAAPVRTVARKVAPVHSHRATGVVRTAPRRVAPVHRYRPTKVVRTAPKQVRRSVSVHHQISTGQRKIATAPAVRTVRKTTRSKTLVQHSKVLPTKINKTPATIIHSAVHKATAVASVPALTTPEITVQLLRVQVSVSPIELTVPLLDEPSVTVPGIGLPPVQLPPITLPPTDPPALTWPVDKATVIEPATQAVPPVTPLQRSSAVSASNQNARVPWRVLAAGTAVLTAHHPSPLSVHASVITSVTSAAVAIVEELGQRIGTARVQDSVAPTATALVLAAAVGAAATGAAGSASGGGSALAVVSAALRLPALGGSRRPGGRLRESAFRMPRLPGFAPD
jgi:hypothetical protein